MMQFGKFFLIFSILESHLFAMSETQSCYKKMSEVLSCFVQHEDEAFQFKKNSEETQKNLRIETYILDSQKWPVYEDADIPSTIWTHKVVLYIPDEISDTVLLYVGSGWNRSDAGEDTFFPPKEDLDYKRFALNNKAIVVELQDVPNQFLKMNGEYKKEDAILAYTYKKFLQDPMKNAYLPGHLPMVKSIVKTMDMVEQILKDRVAKPKFVLAGASKRGWSVWLTAIEDARVLALIPIVIDVLNTQKTMLHICEVYKECPISFTFYKNEGLVEKLPSPEFAELMKVEDPFQYLGPEYHPKYKERFAIPKYILNASGDDFFVPDSSKFFFHQLPGQENYIRSLPNSMHYFGGNPISKSTQARSMLNDAVDSYFSLILKKSSLPKLNWTLHPESIEVLSSIKPKKAVLWTAFNKMSRDFRFVNKHRWWNIYPKIALTFFTKNPCMIGDTCYRDQEIPLECSEENSCKIKALLPNPETDSWRASFLELHYEIDGKDFVLSTEVAINFAKSNSNHPEL